MSVQAADKAKEDLKKVITALNDYLLPRTFLVGERITLADITVACNLLHLYEHVCDCNNRKPYPNVNRWFTTLVNQPEFKAVIGDFKICEKEGVFDPKKFAEFQSMFYSFSKSRYIDL
jgi:elongation factor 1-gamma